MVGVQEVTAQAAGEQVAGKTTHTHHASSDPYPIQSSHTQIQSAFRRGDQANRLLVGSDHKRLAKRSETDSIGTTRSFFVRNVLELSAWDTVQARLIERSERVRLWVETSESQLLEERHQLQQVADSLLWYAETGLPSRAREGHLGILDVLEQYFGAPTDVDGDDHIDVVLLDIRDRFRQTGGYVAGFFDPVNLTDAPYSNKRDIVYLDTYPSIRYNGSISLTNAAATLAHELQHLIHSQYEQAGARTFVNEGLSEYAEVLCGFAARDPQAYLGDSRRTLLSWRYDDPLPDYARASLWTRFLFRRIGDDAISSLVQSQEVGKVAIESLLARSGEEDLESLFLDWGRSLLGATTDDGPAYGFGRQGRDRISFGGVNQVSSIPDINKVELPPLSNSFAAVPYANVMSIRFNHSEGPTLSTAVYSTRPDGSGHLHAAKGGTSQRIESEGRHVSQRVLFSNSDAHAPDTTRSSVSLSGQHSARMKTLKYDDGTADAFIGYAKYLMLSDSEQKIALRFSPGDESWVYGMSANLIFRNQVRGSDLTAESPRDLMVGIAYCDGHSVQQPITPPRKVQVHSPLNEVGYVYLSLAEEYAALSAIDEPFCVVLKNDEDDQNYFAVALDDSGVDAGRWSPGRSGDWKKLSHRDDFGEDVFSGYSPMIRAHTLVGQSAVLLREDELMIEHDHDSVFVQVKTDRPVDSSRTRATATTTQGSGWRTEGQVSHSGLTFAFPIEPTATYTFDVSVAFADRAEVRTRTVEWTPGIEQIMQVAAVYPQPAATRLSIRQVVYSPGMIRESLYDAAGRLVRKWPERDVFPGRQTTTKDLSELAAGVYYLQATLKSQDSQLHVSTHPVVIVR